MKCNYCSAEYDGSICPDCGTPAGMDHPPHQDQDDCSFFTGSENLPPPFQPSPHAAVSETSSAQKEHHPHLLATILAVVLISVLLFAVVFVLFSFFMKNNPDSLFAEEDSYSISVSDDLLKAVQEEIPKKGTALTPEQYEQAGQNADSFRGAEVNSWVQILYDPQYTEDGCFFSFRTVSPKSSAQTLYGVAFCPGCAKKDLYDGSYLSIRGVLLGEYSYTDNFNYIDYAPAVYLQKISLASYADIFAPAIITISPELPAVSKSGCTVALSKAEFAESETRFYLTLENQTAEPLLLDLEKTTVHQNKRIYHWQANYETEDTSVFDEIEPGQTRQLVLTFPPMSEQWEMKLDLQTYENTFSFSIPPAHLQSQNS